MPVFFVVSLVVTIVSLSGLFGDGDRNGHKLQSVARYTVTFTSTWSAASHPDVFPTNPHFSSLVGATHNQQVSFWEPGGISSAGMESMAETGATSKLRSEVASTMDADKELLGGAITRSPGYVELTFDISTSHSFVTLVSMVAPSPDWFVGVSGLNLFENGNWVTQKVIELPVWDAGTDSGTTYSPANGDDDTQPREVITRMRDVSYANPFKPNDVVGTFTFQLNSIVSIEDPTPGIPDEMSVAHAYPNPSRDVVHFEMGTRESRQIAVRLFNVLGEEVRTWNDTITGRTRLSIPVLNLPPGMYVAAIETEDLRVNRTFFVSPR